MATPSTPPPPPPWLAVAALARESKVSIARFERLVATLAAATPTPTSVRDAERRTLHDAFADAGAGPFAAAESRFAFSPFGGVAGGLTPCSVSSVDVSSASTPPDYDAREFAALLKRGEREVRRLKARLVASESAPAREE